MAEWTPPPTQVVPAKVDWPAVLAENDRWLRAVVAARLGNRHAVDEVMQEVAMAAVAQKAPLNDATRAAPWLYRLAVRQVLLYRRKLGRQRKLTERFATRVAVDEAERPGTDPLDWLLLDERRERVREALSKLPPRDSEILLLKYTQDWSYHELAAHLGISHSAVEARLHRARAKLRDQLTAQDLAPASGAARK